MKTKLLLAVAAFVSLLTTSCNVTETITFTEDGSGVMTLDMDGERMMSMAGGQLGGEEKIDSTFSFREIFKERADSIAQLPKEEQERLKKLEKLDVHMVMDPEAGKFNMTFSNKFKKPEELINMMNGFGDATGSRAKMKQSPMQGLADKNPPITYFYDGKKFKKTVQALEKDAEVENDSVQMIMEQLYQAFEGSTYTVTYNFPKKIKSVSNKTAVVSADKKSVTVVYDFIDYMERPKDMDLEVVFE
jgi:hypothetical protein